MIRLIHIIWIRKRTMHSHKAAFEAVDKTFQNSHGTHSLMGNITFVMAGDFKQILPVVPHGTGADEVKCCLKASYLWNQVYKLSLTTSMRVHLQGDQSAGDFAQDFFV